jgi:hypothetical protein
MDVFSVDAAFGEFSFLLNEVPYGLVAVQGYSGGDKGHQENGSGKSSHIKLIYDFVKKYCINKGKA